MRSVERSTELFEEAKKVIPGGVNSPVRSFGAVDDSPLFIERGEGSHIYDADGNGYIDYVLSWGPLILGHAHPRVVEALERAVSRGTSYGAPTAYEVHLAELVTSLFPGMDKVRMVNSGTEATMSALRLARGYTGRPKIIKFIGCYHGHVDYLLVKAGSGAMTLGKPDSPGVTPGNAADTITVPYNDLGAVREAFERHPDDIAAVILEPVAGNMGLVPPVEGFLEGLREVTREYGAVLIFDEVMSGFRAGFPGVQTVHGVVPDLTCLGKVVGGGLPVGAYGGRADIMNTVAPDGPVYQAGTLSGNPLAMAAGIATLEVLTEEGVFDRVAALTDRLSCGIQHNLDRLGLDFQTVQRGTMFSLFFTGKPVTDYDDAAACDTELFAKYFSRMLDSGIYLAPSQFEVGFMSLAHSEEDVDRTIEANYRALEAL